MFKTINDIIFYNVNLVGNTCVNPDIKKKNIDLEKSYIIKQKSNETQTELINTSTHLKAIKDAYKNKYN